MSQFSLLSELAIHHKVILVKNCRVEVGIRVENASDKMVFIDLSGAETNYSGIPPTPLWAIVLLEASGSLIFASISAFITQCGND